MGIMRLRKGGREEGRNGSGVGINVLRENAVTLVVFIIIVVVV